MTTTADIVVFSLAARHPMQTPTQISPAMLPGQWFKTAVLCKGDLLGMLGMVEASKSIYRAELSDSIRTKAGIGPETTTTDSALIGRPIAFAFQAARRPISASETLSPLVRKVPSGSRIISFSGGASANEVGESAPTPVSIGALATTYLKDRKFQGLIVVSAEAEKVAAPGSEVVLTNDVAAAVTQVEDAAFIATMVSYAGANTLASTGTTTANIDADLRALAAFMTASGSSLMNCVLVLSVTAFLYLSTARASSDALAYPALAIDGGRIGPFRVVVSASTTTAILLLDLNGLIFTTGELDLGVSGEASLEMNAAPDSPTTASTVMISLWQQNLAAIRATSWKNWYARPGSAAAITAVGF